MNVVTFNIQGGGCSMKRGRIRQILLKEKKTFILFKN